MSQFIEISWKLCSAPAITKTQIKSTPHNRLSRKRSFIKIPVYVNGTQSVI